MKEYYVTINVANEEFSGRSDELSRLISFHDFISLISHPTFISLTINVSNDSVIPDHQIILKKV